MSRCGEMKTEDKFDKRHGGHTPGICAGCWLLEKHKSKKEKSLLGEKAWIGRTHLFYVRLRDGRTRSQLLCQYKLCKQEGALITLADCRPTRDCFLAVVGCRMHERCYNTYRHQSQQIRSKSRLERHRVRCRQCDKPFESRKHKHFQKLCDSCQDQNKQALLARVRERAANARSSGLWFTCRYVHLLSGAQPGFVSGGGGQSWFAPKAWLVRVGKHQTKFPVKSHAFRFEGVTFSKIKQRHVKNFDILYSNLTKIKKFFRIFQEKIKLIFKILWN